MDRSVYQRMAETENVHWWYVARRILISVLLQQHTTARSHRHILDAGCGSGGNFAMLSRFGEVDAFEFDDAARRIAEQKLGKRIQFAALPKALPEFSKKFDLITCLDVIEHVEDDVGALAELGRILTEDGRLLVTVPALPCLWSQHDVMNHHFRRYTRRSLKAAIKEAGLAPVQIGYFNFLLLPVAVVRRFISNMLGRNSEDDRLPTPVVNSILRKVFASERFLIGRVPIPYGLSLYAVIARR